MATGTAMDVATLKSALTAQPAATVVPPPNPNSSGAVVGGATGTSWTPNTTAGFSLSATGSHTPLTADNVVLAPIFFSCISSALSSINRTVNYGSQAMSSLGAVSLGAGNQWVEFFVLFGPIGAQTITANVTSINTLNFLAASSRSYSGVASVGAVTSNTGSNANPSQTVTSATNDMIVQAFAASGPGGLTLSSYNKTQRYNSGSFNSIEVFLLGDAAGASSVTFSATASSTSGENFVGVAVNLLPSPAVIGSGFSAHNNSTTAVASTSGNNLFPNSFYNVTEEISSDLTYAPATANKITVANAGWYMVSVYALITTSIVSQAFRALLYQNGSAVKSLGPTVDPSTSSLGDFIFGGSCLIYCQAGDTLQPGYNSSISISGALVGETTGQGAYWQVALMNRSLL
jgi:hypothetical protein